MVKIKFKKRNEEGIHCRFCKDGFGDWANNNLYETSPVKGIVCSDCKEHLEDYIN